MRLDQLYASATSAQSYRSDSSYGSGASQADASYGGSEESAAWGEGTSETSDSSYGDGTGGNAGQEGYSDGSGNAGQEGYSDGSGASVQSEYAEPAQPAYADTTPFPPDEPHVVTNLPASPPGTTLFCFALMVADSYEVSLLAGQHGRGVSLFGCNEYAVYSNRSVEIASDLHSNVIETSLQCKYGGEFKTALNTDIFIVLWREVFREARFTLYDWTVKVDADAVFLPERLRQLLSNIKEAPEGAYLSNCKMGMHGPLEVFSRNAVTAWYYGIDKCLQHFDKLCSGPCLWGEDMFIDQCLWKVLHVKRVKAFGMLIEDHCEPPYGWQSCTNASAIAFHPFKKRAEYAKCLTNGLSVTYTPGVVPQLSPPPAPHAAGARPVAGPRGTPARVQPRPAAGPRVPPQPQPQPEAVAPGAAQQGMPPQPRPAAGAAATATAGVVRQGTLPAPGGATAGHRLQPGPTAKAAAATAVAPAAPGRPPLPAARPRLPAANAAQAHGGAATAAAAAAHPAAKGCVGRGMDPNTVVGAVGNAKSCCAGLTKKLKNWNGGHHYFYLCVMPGDQHPKPVAA